MQTQSNYYTLITICQDTKMILAMSNFDSHLEVDNITYSTNKTMKLDTIQSSSSLNSCNTTLTFVSTHSERTKILNNTNLSVQLLCVKIDGNSQITKLILKQGNVGDICIEGNKIIIEIKNIADALINKINHKYSPTCRAIFGDSKCKINPELYTVKKILVKGVKNNTILIDMQSAEIPERLSKLDKNTFELRAIGADIKNHTKIAKVLKLRENKLTMEKYSIDSKITTGDIIEVTFRCNNSYKSCHEGFQNNKNFRGEPQLKNM